MRFIESILCLAIAVCTARAIAAEPRAGADIPEYHVANPSAAVVTEPNLLESERFWPYRVSLLSSWQVPGREPVLAAGSMGVLIRVERNGFARIDFGRDGVQSVPVAATDLLSSANQIRAGQLDKLAPNFVFSIGPRLLDSAAERLAPFGYERVFEGRSFLTVFCERKQLAALAPQLAPFAARAGLQTIVFPQGEVPDGQIRDELRRLEWKVPFVYDHLAEAYTPSLLPAGLALPAVMLQTPEGRVVFQSAWRPDVAAKLGAAIDAELPAQAGR